jgi:hypothetical protein
MKLNRFRVGPQGGYRDGTYYPNGSYIDLPDDGDPRNKAEKELETGQFTAVQRAENPNPLPPTPATSLALAASGQFLAPEGEKTVGELKREKEGGKKAPATAAVQRAVTDVRAAAERAEEGTKSPADKAHDKKHDK